MGFPYIFAGLLFLLNPVFNIIDVIPDFIGLLIIYFALIKLSNLNEDVRYSRRSFLRLAGIGILKALSIGLISSNDLTWYLLLSFTFGVVECIIFYSAVDGLFKGVESLGVKYESEAVFSTYNKITFSIRKGIKRPVLKVTKSKRDTITRLRNTLLAFYFARTFFSVIPEFTQIIGESTLTDYTVFRPALYIIGAFITLIWGTVLLVRMIFFFAKLFREKQFAAKLNDAYASFEDANANYRTSRRTLPAILMFSLTVLSLFNLNEDGLSLIPQLVTSVFVIACAFILAKQNKKALFALIPAVILIPVSVYTYNLKSEFYTPTTKFLDIYHFDGYYERFAPISNLNLVGYVLQTAAVVMISHYLFALLLTHADSVEKRSGISDESAAMIKEENRAYLAHLIKLEKIFVYSALAINLICSKFALFIGELSAQAPTNTVDYAGLLYQALVTAAAILCVAAFVQSRRISNFMRDDIYSIEYNL